MPVGERSATRACSKGTLRVLASPAQTGDGDNPYQGQLYEHLAPLGVEAEGLTPRKLLLGSYDIVHLHWVDHLLLREPPVGYLKAAVFLAAVRLQRWRGAKVVWTVHNVTPHERVWPSRAESWFWALWLRSVDGFIVLSRAGLDEVLAAHPQLRDVPVFSIPHGHYRTYYERAAESTPAENTRKPPGTRYLFFGQMREYKNVPELVRAFIAGRSDGATLSLVGRVAPQLREEIERLCEENESVTLRIAHVPDREIAGLVREADLMVFAHTRVLNSGAALLALSFDRPVVLPKTPTFVELQERVGSEWVFLFEPPLTADTFAEVERWLAERDVAATVDLTPFDWDRIAEETLAAYRSLRPGS